jgi:hypothetical protein
MRKTTTLTALGVAMAMVLFSVQFALAEDMQFSGIRGVVEEWEGFVSCPGGTPINGLVPTCPEGSSISEMGRRSHWKAFDTGNDLVDGDILLEMNFYTYGSAIGGGAGGHIWGTLEIFPKGRCVAWNDKGTEDRCDDTCDGGYTGTWVGSFARTSGPMIADTPIWATVAVGKGDLRGLLLITYDQNMKNGQFCGLRTVPWTGVIIDKRVAPGQ